MLVAFLLTARGWLVIIKTESNFLRAILQNGSIFELGGRDIIMAKTVIRKNESLDDALRRFRRTVSRNGTLKEYRKREYYEKPSVKRKLKSEAARKRSKKKRRY